MRKALHLKCSLMALSSTSIAAEISSIPVASCTVLRQGSFAFAQPTYWKQLGIVSSKSITDACKQPIGV